MMDAIYCLLTFWIINEFRNCRQSDALLIHEQKTKEIENRESEFAKIPKLEDRRNERWVCGSWTKLQKVAN